MCFVFVRIVLAVETTEHLERYRSGHNEAVLKTVCPQGRVGSNPTLSVYDTSHNIYLVISYKMIR